VKIALVAAVAQNRVIGRRGALPWHLPEDLKRFKKLTTGHAVLMGRATYDSIGRPLPDRRNVVLTSRPVNGVECYRSLQEALAALASLDRVFVIGGGTLYARLLEEADELLIGPRFRETAREEHPDFTFVDLVRC
jgi:dihydrofolate reductase